MVEAEIPYSIQSMADKQDEFIELVELHKGIIYKVAHSYANDKECINDIAQEITFQLWRSFDKYDSAYKHSTWIYRIALNTAISYYRKEQTQKHFSSPLPEVIFHYGNDDETSELEGNLTALQQFINELPALDKALMLLYLESKSHKEIAEILGISESNVGTKVGRIKAVLKQKFSSIQNK